MQAGATVQLTRERNGRTYCHVAEPPGFRTVAKLSHMELLTTDEAYAAMTHFLDAFFKRTQSDEIAGLLGAFPALDNGQPADPAIWNDWIAAVKKASKVGCCQPQSGR